MECVKFCSDLEIICTHTYVTISSKDKTDHKNTEKEKRYTTETKRYTVRKKRYTKGKEQIHYNKQKYTAREKRYIVGALQARKIHCTGLLNWSSLGGGGVEGCARVTRP